VRARHLAPLLCAAALAVSGCGAGSSAGRRVASGAAPPSRLQARLLAARLPVALAGESALASGGRLLVIGGLQSDGSSSDAIIALDPRTGASRQQGTLAQPTHDAAAASLGGHQLLFGGGQTASYSGVEELGAQGGRLVGSLPAPRSDLAAATVGARAYLLGGYDGATLASDVLATEDGRRFDRVARLPVPVRYPAVATLAGRVYAFGGERSSGRPTDAIQRIDPQSGRAQVAGALPAPVDHAAALALGGRVFVLGGAIGGAPSSGILSFDPRSGRVRAAGRLPLALDDSAAVSSAGRGYLIGGIGGDSANSDRIVELTPQR